ncbi:MAG: 6-bladed beta-propeller [Verrucomicrobiae bacterium]|nr:6-bladed beta-propeller [Verrucomicrobiae bacterium]
MNARSTWKMMLAGLTASLLVSCATPSSRVVTTETPAPVWPPAPNEPRIRYDHSLHGPADIGQQPGAWHRLAGWLTGDTGERFNLRKPFGVALDEAGNLCLTDTDANLVCYVDFGRKKWRQYAGVGKVKFASPVAVARRGGVFYVADSELAKVFAFRDDGKAVFEISAPLKRPVGLAIAGDALFVVDAQAHAVFVFGLDGQFRSSFGKRGTGPGEFNFPTCAAADARGHLLVADTMNCRVQTFDLQGNFLSQFGGNGDTSGHFARPKGVAVDAEGHSYVVDAVFDNFQIFDDAGRLLLNVAAGGSGPGDLSLPNGIAIGADNRIYVADSFNHRVQIYKYLGQP